MSKECLRDETGGAQSFGVTAGSGSPPPAAAAAAATTLPGAAAASAAPGRQLITRLLAYLS